MIQLQKHYVFQNEWQFTTVIIVDIYPDEYLGILIGEESVTNIPYHYNVYNTYYIHYNNINITFYNNRTYLGVHVNVVYV